MQISVIQVPENWDADKDLEYFLENWPEPQEGYEASIHTSIAEYYRELQAVLDSAIATLHSLAPAWGAICPGELSFLQKVYRLEGLARNTVSDSAKRARLLDDCKGLKWVETTREAIMDRNLSEEGRVWLYELGELCDALCYACMELEQTMRYEFDENFSYEVV